MQIQEPPRATDRRPGRSNGLMRRSQVRRRDAASTAAVIILLVFGLSLLVIVVAQAALGFDPFGLGSTPQEHATVVVAGATPPAPLPTLSPQPPEVAVPDAGARPLVADPGLAALAQQHLGGQRTAIGVAIKNLESGQGVLFNADREFPAGALVSLLIAYEAYHQRDTHRLAFSDPLRVTEEVVRRGPTEAPPGSTVSVGWAVDRLLTRGDPAMAALLLERLGPHNLNATFSDLGLLESRVNGDRATTSPRDLLFLLDRLARGEGLSPASNAELLRYLAEARPSDRLPGLLPRGTVVVQRSANDNSVVGQAAIVYSPAAAIVVVTLAGDPPNATAMGQAQAALGKAVYDYFNTPRPDATPGRTTLGAPPVGPRPSPPPAQLTPAATAALPTAPPAYPTLEPEVPRQMVPAPAQAPTAPLLPTAVPTAPRLAEPPPSPAITAVRPTAPPLLQPTAPSSSFAPAPTAARPTAAPPTAVRPTVAPARPTAAPALVPTVSAPPPTAPARGPLPPTLGPQPSGPTPAPPVPRFGQ
ncbi:MAG: serine hydrolase [Chloroflexi bacterium]|nr:serine hydrolase [Chloroflexota bacterium]